MLLHSLQINSPIQLSWLRRHLLFTHKKFQKWVVQLLWVKEAISVLRGLVLKLDLRVAVQLLLLSPCIMANGKQTEKESSLEGKDVHRKAPADSTPHFLATPSYVSGHIATAVEGGVGNGAWESTQRVYLVGKVGVLLNSIWGSG